jgi:hypothetical protein
MRAIFVAGLAAWQLLGGAGDAWATDPPSPAPRLTSLGEDTLAVKAKQGEDQTTTYVSVLNADAGTARIRVEFQASSDERVRVVNYDPVPVLGERATRVKVTLEGMKQLEDEAVDGQLVVLGGAEPVARAVSITPAPQPSWDWPKSILEIAMLGFAIVFTVGLLLGGVTGELFKPAPGPKWSFDSWATTLTAVGGILGTALGAVTLPDIPREIGKESLIRLNLLFGVIVVVGPFLFQAIRNPKVRATDQDSAFTGWNFTLLLACAITAGAVFGELTTLGLLGWELTGGGDWGTAIVVGVAVLAVAGLWYFVVTVYDFVTTDWKYEDARAKEAAKTEDYGLLIDEQNSDGTTKSTRRVALTLTHGGLPAAPPPSPPPPAAPSRRHRLRRSRRPAGPVPAMQAWRLP